MGRFCPWCGSSREALYWQRLQDDFVQDEIRIGQAGPSSSTHAEEEEGLALAAKAKGKKKKKGGKKNIDFSKVKCF